MALQSAYRVDRRLSPERDRPADPAIAVLDAAGPVAGLHVLVFGPGSLELMCELNHRGADSVTILRPDRWIRPDTADVAFVLDPSSIDALDTTLVHLRRALRTLGTVCLRLPPDMPLASIRAIDRLMAAQGFTGIRMTASEGEAVLSAELPFEVIQ